MGSCLSKKSACVCAASPPPVSLPTPQKTPKSESRTKIEEENILKKDIFIIKHRKSHEIERQQRSSDEANAGSENPEVQKGKNVIPSNGSDGHGNGAPVRTSSCTKEEVDAILIQCGRLSRSSSPAANGGRKFSGSKRSYDFEGVMPDDEVARERERHCQRTPSRERDQQRSRSKERGGGRRVSRSPGKRSESPITTNSNSRPGKMVSVPATVGVEGNSSGAGGAIKRIQVKRNVSPRARSPARARASIENQQQQQPMSLSRSNSRKTEHSPFRRNPLSEIDTNIILQKPNADNKTVHVVSENRNNNLTITNLNSKNQQEKQKPIVPEETTYGIVQSNVGLNVISSTGPEDLKTQPLTRSRSSRLSCELNINPETLSSSPNNNNINTSSSYTALLLEDIHNFHKKNNTPPPLAFTLPPCVTKACSILEAVADLDSSTGSSLSSLPKKMKPEAKDPILNPIATNNDLMEPSFHKYVTVRRGTPGGEVDDDMEEQESSGSNSFAGSQQHWLPSSSSWEPDSAESTDRWTSSSSSSRSVARQGAVDECVKKVSGAKKNGIGRGRMGTRSSNNMAVST